MVEYHELLEKLGGAFERMVSANRQNRKRLFDNEIDRALSELSKQNDFFIEQLGLLKGKLKDIAESLEKENKDSLGLVEDCRKVSDDVDHALQSGKGKRRQLYEESKSLRDFPFFSGSVMSILDEKQRISATNFFESVSNYFDEDGEYHHKLGYFNWRMREVAIYFRNYLLKSTKATSKETVVLRADFSEQLSQLMAQIDIYERRLLDRWALISRKYARVRAEFEYRT